jgi:two-component system sensor histidine kinase HydH
MESWYRIQAALLAAVVCGALGLAVMLRGRRRVEAMSYGGLALSLVGWFIVDAVRLGELLEEVPAAALRGLSLSSIAWTLVGFFRAFMGESDGRALAALVTTRVLAALSFAVTLLLWFAETLFRTRAEQEAALNAVAAFELGVAGLALAASVALMFGHAARVELRSERTRLLSLTYASAGVFSLAFLAYGLDLGVAWLGNMLPAVYMFFIYQVLSLRRILDVFEFVGRMLVLAAFSLVISAIYALIVGWWRYDFGLFLFNTAIASMVILILLDPLRATVETRLAELVFRERVEFTKQAEAIGRSLANVIDVGAMSDLMMSRLEASRQVTHASLYLRDEDGLRLERQGFVGTAPPEELDAIAARPFLARLLASRVVTRDQLEAELQALEESEDLEGDSQREALGGLLATMQTLEAQVVVAFESAGQLVGLIALKNERLREAWAAEELRAIVALAGQATVIVENSRLFDRIRERDRLAAVGQMAAGLAHEIRNPLGAIKGAAQLLGEVEADQRAVFLGIIDEEVERLDGVVSQFLTYARPLRTKRELIDVNLVIERTLTLLLAAPHQSTVSFVHGQNLPQVKSDPELVRQVTLNLSRNAIEAMAPQGGGKLTLSTSVCWRSPTDREHAHSRVAGAIEGGSYVRLRFEDEGPGIAPEVMERLFIPFYTTKTQGTGLGLAICQRIVESLGGFIEVVSRVGHGATMSVYLPVQESQGNARGGALAPA